jgi:hypothetical protein
VGSSGGGVGRGARRRTIILSAALLLSFLPFVFRSRREGGEYSGSDVDVTDEVRLRASLSGFWRLSVGLHLKTPAARCSDAGD